MIHAYSLIHDDLPAMDDDDLRRGKPTCHRAYDEATAILAGDALQPLAFSVIARDERLQVPAQTRLRMIEQLTQASGSKGMVGGQAIDIDCVGKKIDVAQLENMHIHKTGALIRASVVLGAMACVDLTESQLKALDHYSKCIGLAFQVQDDILDIEGSTEELGKQIGADAAHEKPTYPVIIGLEPSRELVVELVEDVIDTLACFDALADPLRHLAQYIIDRRN
jgi:farnesyl diphosphate synthase